MRRISLVFCLIATTGCATIVGGSMQPVTLNANPTGVSFTVRNQHGMQIASGVAPQALRLPRKSEYSIALALDGYQPQSVFVGKQLRGWFWGNLVSWWFVGGAVDLITGAAYALEPAFVDVTMARERGSADAPLELSVRLLDAQSRLIREIPVTLEPIEEPDR